MNLPSAIRSVRVFGLTICIAGAWSYCSLAAEEQPSMMPQPTKEHQHLKFDVGTWDATMKLWEKPGTEPMVSQAVEKNHMVGGFWLVSNFEGKIGPIPFRGSGTIGYDPIEKKYVGTWIDSMMPFMMTMKGDYDPETKTTTMMGENREPNGKMQTTKQISRRVDDNTRVFEMHMPGEDGKFWKMMEITYKRRPK